MREDGRMGDGRRHMLIHYFYELEAVVSLSDWPFVESRVVSISTAEERRH